MQVIRSLSLIFLRLKRPLTLAFCVALAILTLFIALGQPSTLASLSATSSVVSFKVLNARESAIVIRGMKLSAPGHELNDSCLEGVLLPNPGVTVQYLGASSSTGKTFVVSVSEVVAEGDLKSSLGTLVVANEKYDLPNRPFAIVQQSHGGLTGEDDCHSDLPSFFPVAGEATIGRPDFVSTSSSPDVRGQFIGGTLKMSSRGIGTGNLYPIAEVPIPAGSTVRAKCDGEVGCESYWWGVVYPNQEGPGLTVEVSTDSRNIEFLRPHAIVREAIEASVLTQITRDPLIVWLQILTAVLLTGLNLWQGFQSLVERRGSK